MNTDISMEPIACDLTQIPETERTEHIQNRVPALFRAARMVSELPAGYALSYDKAPGIIPQIAEFIENERLCCPFFTFDLQVPPGDAPIILGITGNDGVKEVLGGLMAEYLK